LIGNVIGQSGDTQNPVVVCYGTEGNGWGRNALLLQHNTLIHEG
jgi:hypothetical protein